MIFTFRSELVLLGPRPLVVGVRSDASVMLVADMMVGGVFLHSIGRVAHVEERSGWAHLGRFQSVDDVIVVGLCLSPICLGKGLVVIANVKSVPSEHGVDSILSLGRSASLGREHAAP